MGWPASLENSPSSDPFLTPYVHAIRTPKQVMLTRLPKKADDSDKKRDMDGFSAFLNEATPAMVRTH